VQGILLIDKPKSWTSFDVVNYVRRIVATEMNVKPKNLRVGHIGTLDPLATGLLVLLIGKEYTRRAMTMSKLDKVYEVEMHLGEVSDSFDSETETRAYSDKIPVPDQVNSVVSSFVGEISQLPPIYSALKVDGKRAYDLARAGITPELKPRPVTIYSIKDLFYEYPKLTFSANVSSGTYIRSLVNDIGQELGSGAYMSGLRRTSISDYLIENSISTNNLTAELIAAHLLV
jgi:tRNA pseudouridine55 synthase